MLSLFHTPPHASHALYMLCITLCAASCSLSPSAPNTPQNSPDDSLHLVASASSDGAQGTLYEVLCENGSQIREYVAFGPNGLPEHLGTDHTGQPFSDLFAVLPIGWCDITVTAMLSPGEADPSCTSTRARVEVTTNATTELVLPISCTSDASGALDVAVIVNTIPSLNSPLPRELAPAPTCTPLSFSLSATDPDGDFTTITSEIIAQPPDSDQASLLSDPSGNIAFLSPTPGTYIIEVIVSDGLIDISDSFEISLDGEDLPSCN